MLPRRLEPTRECRLQPCSQPRHRRRHLAGVGHDLHRGIGGRQGADVGGEIAERDVDLVAHAADDRDRRRGDRADEHLFVERPEVFETATAADQGDYIDGGPEPGGSRQRDREFFGRTGALHPRGHHDHLAAPPPREERLEEVGNRGPGGARDDRDPPGERGKRPLPGRGEHALRLEQGVQPPQLGLESPGANGVEPVDRQLVGAAGRVELEPAVADHLEAVGRIDGEGLQGAAPDHRSQHGPVILERQVGVAAPGPREVAHLARHPDVGEPGLELLLDASGQLRHALGIVGWTASVGRDTGGHGREV